MRGQGVVSRCNRSVEKRSAPHFPGFGGFLFGQPLSRLVPSAEGVSGHG